ncbi:molybdopterin synthase catalytic subunit MoaE [endosymbiont of unidentified scaly snail isolate Monju]|uniref:molybdopterin synthase catalytic subunit MoaE n=1 Tax=endosymbiont of unidentified scaly snail isolate Monju TaxID=1248727 RepID=UPI0003891DE7|nr:molybdopterin synthase catalytic subunit MoaE [endosymbiont of unidentified scaly snail isolate Monju]BAN68295.1 molybdopterin synthase catalytic subunit [endosymbiont of unidentified scaly snail isolate Monju]
MKTRIAVQTEPFDLAEETARLSAGDATIGAVASFVGLVRGHNRVGEDAADITTLILEHYPGMTEKALSRIVDAAAERWPLQAVTVIHRVGELRLGEPIVLVLTASAHRQAAFESCQFIMDILKTEAPFWKKERLPDGRERWVDARESDSEAAARWLRD